MREDDYDQTTIRTLEEAADKLEEIYRELKSKKTIFQGTNLPVAEAVEHIIVCLEKDASYLNKLAEICEDSSGTMKKFGQ